MECKQACEYYYSFSEKAFNTIPQEQLEHIRSCSQCQDAIERLEQAVTAQPQSKAPASHDYLALHFGLLAQWVDCDTAKPFLPCLAMKALPLHGQTPVTAHLDACSACRADYDKVRSLRLTDDQLASAARVLLTPAEPEGGLSTQAQRVLSAMGRRPASGIVTRATFSDSGESNALRVETVDASSPRPVVASHRMLRRAASGAAAAIVLIAAILFIRVSSVEALDLHQLYNSLAAAQNLSIRIHIPEEDGPLQQIWISQVQGLKLFASSEATILFDQNRRQLYSRDTTELTVQSNIAENAAPMHLKMPWGLLPFSDITQLAAGFEWTRLDAVSDEQTVVYELAWTETAGMGQTIRKKWVGTLDRTTHLPQTIRWYEQMGEQSSYRLVMRMEVTYPQTAEVLDAVRKANFDGF